MGCNQSSTSNPNPPPNLSHLPVLDDQMQHDLNFGAKYDREEKRPENNADFTAQESTEEQFMATKPWIGALKEPSQRPNVDPSAPTKELTLQFINGFKVEDSRQNIFWTSKPNTIVYPAAAIGVVMDTTSLKQKFMGAGNIKTAKGHTDDIVSLGVDNSRKLVATGSIGAQPLILVWDADTMEIKSRTKLGRNTRAVSTIRFSKDGSYIFCSDKHNDSNVYCFSSSLEAKGTGKCGADPVIDSETGADGTFACATKGGVWFFQYKQGQGLDQNRGIFGENPRQAMTSVTYSQSNNTFISGSSEGKLFFWQDKNCTKVKQLHNGAITALVAINNKIYSSGLKDNSLKISSLDGAQQSEVALPSYAKSIDVVGTKIIVGTKCGRIIQIDGQNKKQLMHGHWCGETWGCAIGNDGFVYTSGDDNNILGFNTKTSRVEKEAVLNPVAGKKYKIGGASTLSLLPPNQQSRALAINRAGHLAIASNDGDISIRSTKDLNNQIFHDKKDGQWIQVMRYSPDETKLAVGSHDNNIYIYDVSGNSYSLRGALKGHNAFITGLDWSTDGNAMQSVCGAYELLFWDIPKMAQVTEGGTKFRDQKWATLTVKINWSVQGIFPADTNGTHIHGVDRTKDGKIIVTADNYGLVNLYRNPCLKGGNANSFRAHSSHVVKALLDEKDQFIYSVGGFDKTLMVWKVSN